MIGWVRGLQLLSNLPSLATLKNGQPPHVENSLRTTLRIFAGASRQLAVGQAQVKRQARGSWSVSALVLCTGVRGRSG